MHTCSGSSTSTVDYYFDNTCKTSYQTVTNAFEQCYKIYSSSATQTNPSLANYQYGICQSKSSDPSTSTSSTDDDEITLSESDYGGAITGTLICGIIIGLVVGAIALKFCCGFSPVPKESSNENQNQQEGSNSQKSSLSQPIVEEKTSSA